VAEPRPPTLEYSTPVRPDIAPRLPFSLGAVVASLVCLVPTGFAVLLVLERARAARPRLGEGTATVALLLIAIPAFLFGVAVLAVIVARAERRGGWLVGLSLVVLALAVLVRVVQGIG
jgi:ABC-type dipeptide/oligopeptide/nickel transport system permease component